ncbi:MAG TPA: (Fe-S)-binding protein [Methanocella sp.]|nr:(Fe-S)-binding protein [Methanocella sp.]
MSQNNCNPLYSIYCNFKVRIVGGLSENDLSGLYRCTLCNSCGTAGFNRGAREIAVGKGLVAPHAGAVRMNIWKAGNPYGVQTARKGGSNGKMDTILWRGCTTAYRTPEILEAAASLLNERGVEYGYIDDEGCCGNILFNLGDLASGRDAVRSNIEKFEKAGVKRIITVCPGCYSAFRRYYKGVGGFDPEVLLAADLLDGLTADGKGFSVQDPCHAKEKGAAVRKMLPGVGSKSISPCCGAGAGLMIHDHQLADAKALDAAKGTLGSIVTYCPFCYLYLSRVRPGRAIDLYMLLAG